MAACNLKIELDEPRKVRMGGDEVTGTVVVRCDKETNCKGLVISTRWTTHGRGNIDSGTAEEVTPFQGSWQAGQDYKYPFALKCATWPPTYFGTYLNVSHVVEARAKIAWAIDPKATAEFPVVATASPANLTPQRKVQQGGLGIFALVIFAIVALIFLAFFWWLIPIALIGIAVYWFFKSFLPKQLTGSIKTELEPRRVRAGEPVRGNLSFTPQRNVSINSVNFTFSGIENCVSGSGSNRKSHKNDLLKQVVELTGPQRLTSGQRQSFDFEIQVPPNAAPSMKLTDNQIQWSVLLRIDIPRWPDWTETIELIVEPGESTGEANRLEVEQAMTAEDEWFEQVLQQLQESDDTERMQLVLEAIREHEFTVTLDVAGEAFELASNYAPEVPGKWFETYDKRRDMCVELFVPSTAPEPQIDSVWRGRIGIVGYSSDDEVLSARMLV